MVFVVYFMHDTTCHTGTLTWYEPWIMCTRYRQQYYCENLRTYLYSYGITCTAVYIPEGAPRSVQSPFCFANNVTLRRRPQEQRGVCHITKRNVASKEDVKSATQQQQYDNMITLRIHTCSSRLVSARLAHSIQHTSTGYVLRSARFAGKTLVTDAYVVWPAL